MSDGGDDRDMNAVTAQVYADTHATTPVKAAVASTKSRIDEPDEIAQAIDAGRAETPAAQQAAAGEVLRHRLHDPYHSASRHPQRTASPSAANEPSPYRAAPYAMGEARPGSGSRPPSGAAGRRSASRGRVYVDEDPYTHPFMPPPLHLPAGSGPAKPGDSHADGGAPHDGPTSAERDEALREKRAHVAMLRLQVDAARSSAESRANHVARVMDAARKRHHERVTALVETGNDHPLEKLRPTGPSPYSEDLVEVFDGGRSKSPTSRRTPAGADATWASVEPHTISNATDEDGRASSSSSQETVGEWDGNDSAAVAESDEGVLIDGKTTDERRVAAHRRLQKKKSHQSDYSDDEEVHGQQDDDRTSSRPQSSQPSSSKPRMRDHRETQRLQARVRHQDHVVTTTRDRVTELKRRLIAQGIDVSQVEAKFNGSTTSNGGKRGSGRPLTSAELPEVDVNPRLYPGHAKVAPRGEAQKAATPQPGGASSAKQQQQQQQQQRSTEAVKVKEMDPTVLKRLYRPPGDWKPPEHLDQSAASRTAMIHKGREPYRGDAPLPKSETPKPNFSEDTVKRIHDSEMQRRAGHLKQSEMRVHQSHAAEINAVRKSIGLPPRKFPSSDGKRVEGYDASGVPVFTKDKAARWHDDVCARFANGHQRLVARQEDDEAKQQLHKPRKLTNHEQKAAAARLHDESSETTKKAMSTAAERANAVNAKAATAFQRVQPKNDDELRAMSTRLTAGGKD